MAANKSIAAADLSNHDSNATLLAAALADITAIRTTVAALVVDVTNLLASHNTLATKLNADGGVTDTNYAAGTALTASAPAALTLLA